MIQLVKSSNQKLKIDSSQKDSLSQTRKVSINLKFIPVTLIQDKDDEIPTPKASSKIILKASKNTNFINTQPQQKNEQQSITTLARALQKKNQDSNNLSQYMKQTEFEEMQMQPLSHREKITNSAKLLLNYNNQQRQEDDNRQNQATFRQPFPAKKIQVQVAQDFDEQSRQAMQKMFAQTTRLPKGLSNVIKENSKSQPVVFLHKTQQLRLHEQDTTITKHEKVISPRKIDQLLRGIQQRRGDQTPLAKSIINSVNDASASALSSFVTNIDQRLNQGQKNELQDPKKFIEFHDTDQRKPKTLANSIHPQNKQTKQSITPTALFKSQHFLNINEPKMYILREKGDKHVEKSDDGDSAADPGSLDVDEEVCTREHFNNLMELHQPMPRTSNLLLTPATKHLVKDLRDSEEPENIRESRKVQDARSLMLKFNEKEDQKLKMPAEQTKTKLQKKLKDEYLRKQNLRLSEQTKPHKIPKTQKFINNSIQARNKSKFFNPSVESTMKKQQCSTGIASEDQISSSAIFPINTLLGKRPQNEDPPKSKSALMERHAVLQDQSPTPTGLSNSAMLQPSTMFSRKQSTQKANYFKVMITHKIMLQIMQYLTLDVCFRLKIINQSKCISRDLSLKNSFEIQFFKAILIHNRTYLEPNNKGKSKLCLLIARFLEQVFQTTKEQEIHLQQVYLKSLKKIANLNKSADYMNHQDAVGFEIEKDVDRTFQDCAKFSKINRQSLANVLKAFAMIDKEVGYVQGLNFIVANFILVFDIPRKETKWLERRALASSLGLLKVLHTRDFYTERMLGLKEAIFKLECILYNLIPEVYIFLLQNQISLEYFVSQWFITLFQYDIDNHEQCMMILILCLFFGQKMMFQIAFQMIKEIRSKLVNFTYEEALLYLKEFASEPRFSKVEFLMRAMENDLITASLINELGLIYGQFRKIYSDKEISSFSECNPLSQRVRFLRGSMPGKINIKVIWPSLSPSKNIDQDVTQLLLKQQVSESFKNVNKRKEDAEAFQIIVQQVNGYPTVVVDTKNSKSVIVRPQVVNDKRIKKRSVGSFVLPANGKHLSQNSFSELATVSESHSQTDFERTQLGNNAIDQTKLRRRELFEQRDKIKKPNLHDYLHAIEQNQKQKLFTSNQRPKRPFNEIKITTQSLSLDVADEDSNFTAPRRQSQREQSSLFQRLGIYTKTTQQTNKTSQYQSQSRATKNAKFGSSSIEHQMSQTSSEEYRYYKDQHQGIKIIKNEFRNHSSSQSKTDSDYVSQETDQLESEMSSFPMRFRMQANSALSLADLGVKQEDDLVGNEYSTIDPPLFHLSPQATNQINSRAIYKKESYQIQGNKITNDPSKMRPGTKTKLDQRKPNIQPTQSNFDIESDMQTLSTRNFVMQKVTQVISPSADRTLKIKFTQKNQPSENVVESDKRQNKVNNISLNGGGFDKVKYKHDFMQEDPLTENEELFTYDLFPISETVKAKHPFNLTQMQTPLQSQFVSDFPLSTDRVPMPSQQIENLKNQSIKRMKNESQVTDEDLHQQSVFIQKFQSLNAVIKPTMILQKHNQKYFMPDLSAEAAEGESVGSGSPINLDERLIQSSSKSQFNHFNDYYQRKDIQSVNYNTRDNFTTVRSATQNKVNPVLTNNFPQPKSQVETPNMTQIIYKQLRHHK